MSIYCTCELLICICPWFEQASWLWLIANTYDPYVACKLVLGVVWSYKTPSNFRKACSQPVSADLNQEQEVHTQKKQQKLFCSFFFYALCRRDTYQSSIPAFSASTLAVVCSWLIRIFRPQWQQECTTIARPQQQMGMNGSLQSFSEKTLPPGLDGGMELLL